LVWLCERSASQNCRIVVASESESALVVEGTLEDVGHCRVSEC
jgi:hypothetical protein